MNRKTVLLVYDSGELVPACPYCKEVYQDSAIFDVKNYPADGNAIMFFECEECNEEAEFVFSWKDFKDCGVDNK